MIKIVPNFNLKRGVPLIFEKKDPFLKNGSGSNVEKKTLNVRRATLQAEDSIRDPGNLKHT